MSMDANVANGANGCQWMPIDANNANDANDANGCQWMPMNDNIANDANDTNDPNYDNGATE